MFEFDDETSDEDDGSPRPLPTLNRKSNIGFGSKPLAKSKVINSSGPKPLATPKVINSSGPKPLATPKVINSSGPKQSKAESGSGSERSENETEVK